jgi:hypothetical protein
VQEGLTIHNRQSTIGNGGSPLIRSKVIFYLALTAVGGIAYFFFIYRPRHRPPIATARVVPTTLPVVDTPAEVHLVIGTLKGGEQVLVLDRTHNWSQVRMAEGGIGWVESKDLLDTPTYERAQAVAKELANFSAQAAGHTNGVVNLRLEPSRDAAQLAQLPQNEKVEVFGRRVVERPPDIGRSSGVGGTERLGAGPAPESPGPPGAPVREAWYLVRVKSPASLPVEAGWVLGRFVELDIPQALSMYAQGTNLVAWMVLNTVEDGGQQVPQYLVADRVGTQEVDFNHLRVFTWWVQQHRYATAYVESGLNGHFPMRVDRRVGIPYFRLRLMDGSGRKFQKVYGLFDTRTRPVGIVEGWESDAMPTQPLLRLRVHKRRR